MTNERWVLTNESSNTTIWKKSNFSQIILKSLIDQIRLDAQKELLKEIGDNLIAYENEFGRELHVLTKEKLIEFKKQKGVE